MVCQKEKQKVNTITKLTRKQEKSLGANMKSQDGVIYQKEKDAKIV